MPQPLIALLLIGLSVPPGTLPWRYEKMVDGIRVEARDVPGSPYQELRISTVSKRDLKSLCDAVFSKGNEKPESRFKKREVLRETSTDRWTYEQVSVPIVRDRDYVMHVKLDQPPSEGRCQVSFQTEDDPHRPPVRGVVRIPSVRGRWSLAQAGGVVDVSYEVYSDPGGHLPAFLVRGGQRDAAVDFMKTILARGDGLKSK
jgi:hypothetical protein